MNQLTNIGEILNTKVSDNTEGNVLKLKEGFRGGVRSKNGCCSGLLCSLM